ncbi:hypothetical protein U0L90_12225 [Flavobacteriaceae sp. LMIT009]
MAKIKGLISPEEAKELSSNFTTRCELISKDIVGRPDNRSSWYSLKDLKKYLKHAKKQAKKNGYKMNGVRIYCGAYPTVDEQVGYSTSFIVPTARIIDGKDGGGGNGDIPGGDGFNDGKPGNPPGSGYPQD